LKRWLLVIIGLWFFQGCSASDSVEVAITFPDQAGKNATITLRTYSLIPGEGVSCVTLNDGTNSPEDGLSTIESQQTASNPFDSAVSPLRVSKKNTATRLFFSQGENDVGMVMMRGCSEVNVADGGSKVSISLVACEPTCPFGKGDCDNNLGNGCEADLDTVINCGGCGKICGNQHAISEACIKKTCDFSCEPGWGNCDQIGSNGCEGDLSERIDCNNVLKPAFGFPAGTYQNDLAVSIRCSDSEATIYYTIHGDTPTKDSTPYTGTPISIIGPYTTVTIKAIATIPGMNQSAEASATYTVRYRYTLTLTVNDATFGGIEQSSPLTVDHGAATNIVATLTNSDYKFLNWTEVTGTGVSFGDPNSASTTVTLTGGDAMIQANFVPKKDVYVAGHSGLLAEVWKNGNVLFEYNGDASSVFVSGNDVYVAGAYTYVAKLWKNEIETSLSNNAEARSVFVVGNDVYVAGDGTSGVAKVWKQNGTNLETLMQTDGSTTAYAHSIFVSDNIVYVAGYENAGTTPHARVWKQNGTTFDKLLVSNEYSSADSVFVSGSDVYVAGYEKTGSKSIAKLWKQNGTSFDTLMATGGSYNASASSVFVSGSDVYVAGYENNGTKDVAKVWKQNGATFDTLMVTNGSNNAYATSIFVSESDVYVAGHECIGSNCNAKVWKQNGTDFYTLFVMAVSVPAAAYANSVFVVP
jgi:hypothetical protein